MGCILLYAVFLFQHSKNLRTSAMRKYPDSSLADMYLYLELFTVHQANDAAVKKAYRFKDDMTEEEILAEHIKEY